MSCKLIWVSKFDIGWLQQVSFVLELSSFKSMLTISFLEQLWSIFFLDSFKDRRMLEDFTLNIEGTNL